MYKLWKRICAYIIDVLIITMITQSLSNTTILNPNLNKYQKYQKEYTTAYNEFIGLITQLQKDYEDKKLTEEEYNKLIDSYPLYENKINKYYQNQTLTKKNFNKLINSIAKQYTDKSSKLYFLVEKNSISEIVIYLILTLLYFIGFNYLTDGQTLGKKITHLKIVSNIDKHQKVSLISYLIRALLMYQVIYYLMRLVCILCLKESQYLQITSFIYYVQNTLDFIIIMFILIRKDKRGLHDILANTKVIQLDKKETEFA